MKPATLVTTVLLLLIAVAHLLRLIFRTQVTVGRMVIPTWVSVVATIVSAALAVALWRENAPSRKLQRNPSGAKV